MNKTVIVIILYFYIDTKGDELAELCDEKEELVRCLKGPCIGTCAKPIVKCVNDCSPKCVCKDGYVRNFREDCVLYDHCFHSNSSVQEHYGCRGEKNYRKQVTSCLEKCYKRESPKTMCQKKCCFKNKGDKVHVNKCL